MPDDPNTNPDNKGGDNNNNDGGKGNDPSKTNNQPSTIDISKLGDEDLAKVLEDPRLWKLPRIQELNERAKAAKKYESEQKAAEEAKLKEQGKLQELTERLQKERDEAINKFNSTLVDMKIQSEATKLGAIDTEAVLKLIDRSTLKPDENGNITGLEDAVKALQTSKPYLFGKPGTVSLGNPTNPGQDNNNNVRRFKHSQIQDPEFYKANEKEILQAYKLGLIENDLAQ